MGIAVVESEAPKVNGEATIEVHGEEISQVNGSKLNGEVKVEVNDEEVNQVNGSKLNGEVKAEVNDEEVNQVNGSDPVSVVSNGIEEKESEIEENDVSKANVPVNAVDEWPDAPKVRSFWVVKYRTYEDPSIKAKIDQVDREIQKINQKFSQIIEQLKPKRASRTELKEELVSLAAENSQYVAVMNEKRQEIRPLQDALGTLRGSGGGVKICATEGDLNNLIRSLEYTMQHETISLKEEKQLLREIKELEATRPQVIANAARRAKIQESLGKTEVIQDQVKLLGSDLDGVKKQRATIKARMDQLGGKVKAIDEQMKPLKAELDVLDGKRKQAFDKLKQLRSQRDEGNAPFYQNRNMLNGVKELASRNDLKALGELVNAEVEKFMSQWNSSKAFRDDYEKRILMSLDIRQLSRDGRIRNFDEKPILKPEEAKPPSQVEPLPKPVQKALKAQKEDAKTSTKAEHVSTTQKVEPKEPNKNNKESKTSSDRAVEEEKVFVVEKPKESVPKENEVIEVELKEKKREEEKEKQRQAFERKKKKQEKAAAKAALRALKEADKKQKDREKKLKKKEGTSTLPTEEEEEEVGEKEAEEVEHEKLNNSEAALEMSTPPSKPKEQKDNAVRNRKKNPKTPKTRVTVPKAILKKKKNNQYWIWASVGAVAVVIVLLLALTLNHV